MSQPKYYVEGFDEYDGKGGGTGDLRGPFLTFDDARKTVTNKYDFTSIIEVKDNELTTVAWWDHVEWSYLDGFNKEPANDGV